MGFAERLEQHDRRAFPLVREIFERHGYNLYPFGIELVPELQRVLSKLGNGTSQMLRYRPDAVAVNPKKRSLLLEIKSEGGRSPNFAVEYDAWVAMNIWNRNGKHVLCVFADLSAGIVYSCWPEEMRPEKIFVPRMEDVGRIRECHPDIPIKHCRSVGGSGTAFFLVPKSRLSTLDVVLGTQLGVSPWVPR